MYIVLKANCEEDQGIVLSLKFACIIYLISSFYLFCIYTLKCKMKQKFSMFFICSPKSAQLPPTLPLCD